MGQAERRRHSRIELSLKGRFMRADGSEHPCTLRNVSLSGVMVDSDVLPIRGEHVIVQIDDLGRFEGTMVREVGNGFAVEVSATIPRKDRMAERLRWYAKPTDGEDDMGGRQFPRVTIPETIEAGSQVKFDDDTAHLCRVVDISLTGVRIAVDTRPKVGTEVTIGKMRGRVVRFTEDGVAVEFIREQAERKSDESPPVRGVRRRH